jgi:predicted transcriptional regulator of viral defense system
MDDASPGRKRESSGWPDREIGELAGRQQTMVTAGQLRGFGLSRSAVTRALRRGRLHRVHRGVYSLVVPSARPALAAERAALLACGPSAVLSHHTAARMHGFRAARAPEVHVTVVAQRRVHPGLVVHRTNALDRAERTRAAGLPVTSVARTVIDLAPDLSLRGLEHLVDQALRKTSRTKLREATARHASRAGVARVARLLDPSRPSSDTWSKAEERLRQLIRRAEQPEPESNVPVGAYVPDLLWRAERVIVEYDSEEFHSGPVAARWDAVRHNTLTAQRFYVIHLTADDILKHPERTLALIVTALARGGR